LFIHGFFSSVFDSSSRADQIKVEEQERAMVI